MGERYYEVGDYSFQFSESDIAWTCLCTFPHNNMGHMDADTVRSLALLGAAAVLALHGGEEVDGPILPYNLPAWIRDGIISAVPVSRPATAADYQREIEEGYQRAMPQRPA